MTRTRAVAIAVAGLLMTAAAHDVAASRDREDHVEAPRDKDHVQAPRGEEQIQAPRGRDDVQAPRGDDTEAPRPGDGPGL